MYLNMEVTKRVDYECCYIYNCHIEAHHCKLEVTVVGPQRFTDSGTVITFEDLTRYIHRLVPHQAFLYWDKDVSSINVAHAFSEAGCRVEVYDFPISAENMCKNFADKLQELFDIHEPGIKIIDLKLREDNNSYVSWKQET